MPDAERPPVEWRMRRAWLVRASVASLAWAAAWIGGYAALGWLDRVYAMAYVIMVPFVVTLGAVWGRCLRLTGNGIEYEGGLSRWSIDWADVEALDRRGLTYALYRETTTDTGLKISRDSLVRATPRKHRRIPLRPFVDDERYAELVDRLREHRPDLEPG